MKQNVLQILNSKKSDLEKFNSLFQIYRNIPGKSDAMIRYFNLQGYKPNTFDDLVYQVCKELQISDFDIANYKTIQLKPKIEDEELSGDANSNTGSNDDSDDDDSKNDNPDDDSGSEAFNFREEYPFLNNPEIPEEFKILAADKITAYKTLQEGHEKLRAISNGESDLSEEEAANIAKVVSIADELNSLIKEEFDHYKETGEILGKHPIFKERVLIKKIEKMTGEQKSKRITNLNTYIRRDSKKLSEAKTEEDKKKWTEKVQDWETELKLIEKSM